MGRPVVHFELWTKDPQRLGEFYARVFGWGIRHIPELDYRLIETGGRGINGGMMTPKEGPWPGDMTFYIDVDDLDAYVRRIRDGGGKVVVERMEVPGVGSLALFEDPDGRVLGVCEQEAGGGA